MSKRQMNNLAAVLPMYEAFKKLEGILDEALDLLRAGVELSEGNHFFRLWRPRATEFIETHNKRISVAGKIAVGKLP